MPQCPMNYRFTHDFAEFKGMDLDRLMELMKHYLSQGVEFFEGRVGLCFHPATGRIFLMDDYCRVAMMDNGVLKQWATCEVCGADGFIDSENPKFVDESLCSKCPPPPEEPSPEPKIWL